MFPLSIFLVRHGRSEGNSAFKQFKENNEKVFSPEFLSCPNSHYRLTDKGREQSKVVGLWLKNWLKEKKLLCFSHHFVSSHIRTLETAALLDLPEAKWKLEFQLRERENGLWGVVPDEDWKNKYSHLANIQQNHHFFTPLPGGESIADVCARLRPFVETLNTESSRQGPMVIVAHGDLIQALRVIFENILPDDYDAFSKANDRDFRIGNGQVIHYTRVRPEDPMYTTSDGKFGWVRSLNPWDPEYAGHDWRPIKKSFCSNEELLDLVAKFPRLIGD